MAASYYTCAWGSALQSQLAIPKRETGTYPLPVFSFSLLSALWASAQSEAPYPGRGKALLCVPPTLLGGTFMDSSSYPRAVQVAGWSGDDAVVQLKRLLNCGYRVRFQRLDGFRDRCVLWVEADKNPGVWQQVAWSSQVSALCLQQFHLPIDRLSPSAGVAFPDAYALGQASLPGVR